MSQPEVCHPQARSSGEQCSRGTPSCLDRHDEDTGARPAPALDVVCEHGTAMDVHCCNCHSGFIFDTDHICPPADCDAPATDVADLLRRLDKWLERSWENESYSANLVREARDRFAQIALLESYAAMGRRCETDNGTHCPEDVSCGEYITALTKRAEQAEAQLREAEARVRELSGERDLAYQQAFVESQRTEGLELSLAGARASAEATRAPLLTLEESAQSLLKEVNGLLGLAEHIIREEVGNTNLVRLRERAAALEAALRR